MKLDFSGMSVVITGASRGIGLGIAKAFADAGAELTLIADDEVVTEIAAGLGARGSCRHHRWRCGIAGIQSAFASGRVDQQCRT
jgi:NAD(P)-dependent dehydrogenase (short-subunit alcohol dehydrogenase family)